MLESDTVRNLNLFCTRRTNVSNCVAAPIPRRCHKQQEHLHGQKTYSRLGLERNRDSGAVAQWRSGALAHWRRGAVAQWAVAQWRSGAVAQWRSGAVAQWRSGAELLTVG